MYVSNLYAGLCVEYFVYQDFIASSEAVLQLGLQFDDLKKDAEASHDSKLKHLYIYRN